jgi:hypothetical protein
MTNWRTWVQSKALFSSSGCSASPNSICIIVLNINTCYIVITDNNSSSLGLFLFFHVLLNIPWTWFVACLLFLLIIVFLWLNIGAPFALYVTLNKVLCSANMFCNLLFLCCRSSVPIITAVWRDPADIRDTAEVVLHWLRRIVSMTSLL